MAEYNPSKIIKDGNTYNFRDTTKIPLAGSNAISGSLIPSTDETVNLGSPSYQWNQAYIKSLIINGVACGDILTHNADEFVDVSSNQTIGGVKTFSDGLFASKSTAGELATLEDASINSANEDANGMPLTGHTNSLKIKGSQVNVIPCMLTGQVFTSGDTTAELRVYKYKDTSRKASFNIRYIYASDVAQAQFVSCNISTNADGVYDIGSSIAQWKSCYTKAINGLNPGALSLPSGTVGMNLIGDVSVVGTEKKLSKDITITGYIYVDVSFTSSNRLNLYNDTKKYGIWLPCNSGRIRQIMPISTGDRLEFNVLDDGSTVNAIQLFACQGNV